MSFEGQVILVTGASSGIGAEVARHFASLGGSVALVGRNEARLNEVAKQIGTIRALAAFVIVADVVTDTERILNETIAHYGKLDVLVNNAGVYLQDNIETYTDAGFEQILDTNIRGVMKLTQLAVPHLAKTKGNIVNVSSINGMKPFKNALTYCMSKAAIDQFTQCTALDLADKGIRVNSVNPGIVKTSILKTAGMTDEQVGGFYDQYKTLYPLGRVGEVPDIAHAVAFLASNSSSFLTGVLLPVDGGFTLTTKS